MAADPNLLYVLATLQQRAGRFNFVVRWLPGASDNPHEGDNLPTPADVFRVSFRRPGAGLWLQSDQQTWGAAPHCFEVRPKPYAMVDPPRIGARIPDAVDPTDQWLVGREPDAPVDPALKTLRIDAVTSAPMGVCHLLEGLDKERVAYRVYEALLPAAAQHASRKDLGAAALSATEVQRWTAELAVMLVSRGHRPLHLPQIIAIHQRRLTEFTTAAEKNGTLDRRALQISNSWRKLALYAGLLRDPAAISAADYEQRSGTQPRQQLRLKALQGGVLLDFWGGLDRSLPNVLAPDRGIAYPSAFLLGLGDSFGGFSAADVQAWRTRLPNGSVDIISVDVEHELDPQQQRRYGFGPGATEHLQVHRTRNYKAGRTILKDADLDQALTSGSSNPPLAPPRAWVNYSLVRTWVNPEAETTPADGELDTSLTFSTGDGRIEILVEPAPLNSTGSSELITNTVIGYNVYGVWEGASQASDAWFNGQDPQGVDELKPWLITRRYSLSRDLAPTFPPISGQPHPRLKDELLDPAWHPILQRSTEVTDVTTGASLPSVTNTADGGKVRFGIFGFDLRRGAQATPALPAGVPGAWDPVYPPQPGWAPEMWRGELQPGAHAAPQRYRFWVTAVDSMEQESAPVAVATADTEAGEAPTDFFRPQRRTQLGPPPRRDPSDPDALKITIAPNASSLLVSFGTPLSFMLGSHSAPGAAGVPLDPAGLTATVLLMRRRLRPQLAPITSRVMDLAGKSMDTPPWAAALRDATGKGWESWQRADVMAPSGGIWSERFDLDTSSRSFEYMALVGFQVKPTAQAFWHRSSDKRTVQATRNRAKPGDPHDFVLALETTQETPATGTVAASPSVVLQSDARARPAERAAAPFLLAEAAPVLPPPGVNRDLVLMRLLSQATIDGQTTLPPRSWPTPDGPLLREGQIAMCETALARVSYAKAGEKPSADEIDALRQSVARVCAGGETGKLNRSGLIGFRGVGRLTWTYKPFKVSPPTTTPTGTPTEAEAGLFRIYGATAPRSNAEAGQAPLRAVASRTSSGVYALSALSASAEVIAALESGAQPALVRFSMNGEPVLANLLAFTGGAAAPRVTLEALDGALPTGSGATWSVQILLGRVVREVLNTQFKTAGDCTAWVPVFGGPSEAMVWWVASVSAEQQQALLRTSGGKAWPVMLRKFAASVQPRAPQGLGVRSVTEGTADLRYNLADPEHRKWCPRDLDQLGAEFLPRLYLSWEAPDVWESVDVAGGALFIEVDREYVSAGEGSTIVLKRNTPSAWEAIRSMERMRPEEPISMDWIRAIRDDWLLGREVDTSDQRGEDLAFIRADTRPLKAAGLTLMPKPSGDVYERFIDYYREPNTNLEEVIDSDHRYRYRLRYAQDTGVGSTWRYLRSEWSEWSSYILPVAPELSAHDAGKDEGPLDGVVPPRVRFAITSKQLVSRRARHHAMRRRSDVDWFYRVMVYRQVRSMLAGGGGDDPGLDWIEIEPVLLLKPDQFGEIIDNGFERPSYGEAFKLTYRIVLQQIVRDPATQEERPVRTSRDGALPVVVDVPAPRSVPGGIKEVEVVRAFNVR